MELTNFWKKCSSCKKPINFGAKYFVCSVSTCNGERTGYVFCSVPCFEAHLPGARHRDAGAVEEFAPKQGGASVATAGAKPQKRIIPNLQPKLSNKQISQNGDILVIASRMKEFISEQSEFNTSGDVMAVLSIHLRHVAMQAIDNARAGGRKTVMSQDLKFLDKLNLNI